MRARHQVQLPMLSRKFQRVKPWYSSAKATACLLSVLFLSACAGPPQGPKFVGLKAPADSLSALYIYRPIAVTHGGFAPLLAVDGVDVTTIKNGGYVRREVPAGEHVLELKPPSEARKNFKARQFEVTTKPGSITFVRHRIELINSEHVSGTLAFIHNVNHTLELVDEATALAEISQTKLND